MKMLAFAVLSLVSLAFIIPGQADHGCNGTITTVDAGAQTLYLDDRSAQPGERAHWLYLESNGVDGLQTGGEINLLPETWEPAFGDRCAHMNADKLIAFLN